MKKRSGRASQNQHHETLIYVVKNAQTHAVPMGKALNEARAYRTTDRWWFMMFSRVMRSFDILCILGIITIHYGNPQKNQPACHVMRSRRSRSHCSEFLCTILQIHGFIIIFTLQLWGVSHSRIHPKIS